MEFNEVLNSRYSVRKYKDEPINEEILDEILHAGYMCPTAKNQQPQRFYVVKTEEDFEKLEEGNTSRYGAPVMIIICADMNACWASTVEEGYTTAEMDASIATTYMMLKAQSLGVSSVWVRRFISDKVKKNFNFPDNIKPIALLTLGYAADDCMPSINHTKTISFEDMMLN